MKAVTGLAAKLTHSPIMRDIFQISRDMQIPIYLVGGAVRDLLLGIPPEKDFDFVTPDNPGEVARHFSRLVSGHLITWKTGPPNYRVIFYRNRNRIEVDFSGFRGPTITDDLINRDFTVNAIALAVDDVFRTPTPRLLDPSGGRGDLLRRTLRITSPRAFDDDPLRILRAFRISRARNLVIDTATKEEMLRKKEQLRSVAPERIRSEFFTLLGFPSAEGTVADLDRVGILSLLLPEAESMQKQLVADGHGLAPWEHALDTLRRCEEVVNDPGIIFPDCNDVLQAHFSEEIEAAVDRRSLIKLAALLHDYPPFSPAAHGGPVPARTAHHSQRLHALKMMAARFKLGKKTTGILRTLFTQYAGGFRLLAMGEAPHRAYFQFFRQAGADGPDALVLFWADVVSRYSDGLHGSLDEKARRLTNRLAVYYFTEYRRQSPRPLVSGREIMERFGLKEGAIIGTLLEDVARAEADGLICMPEEAILRIEALLQSK